MPMKIRNLLGAALIGTSLFCTTSAMAVTVVTCNDISGNSVKITECSNFGSDSSYSLFNGTPSDIYGFYVSTQAGSQSQSASTTRPNWLASYINRNSWDSLYFHQYGSFNSLFGSVDTGVFSYLHQGDSTDDLIAAGQDTGKQFYFGAFPASDFIAIDGNNTIIARSFDGPVPNIPEPTSLALLGLGIVSLAAVRRKRQTR